MRRSPRLPAAVALLALVAACGGSSPTSAPPGTPPSAAGAASGGNPALRPQRTAPDPDLPKMATTGDICVYATRAEPIMQGHRDATGSDYLGEVRVRDVASFETKWISAFSRDIATAVARPRVEKYRVVVDDNCFDPQRRVYTRCTKVIEVDLSKVRGFARAVEMPGAHALAAWLCEQKVRELVLEATEVQQDSRDLRCGIAEERYCPRPAPPPAAPSARPASPARPN
jgi:hypothetical protein